MSTAIITRRKHQSNSGTSNNKLILALFGIVQGNTQKTPNQWYKIVNSYDTDFLTYDSNTGLYTVNQSCSVNMIPYARGIYNSAGNSYTGAFKVYVNDTLVASQTGITPTCGNFTVTSYPVTLTQNDVIKFIGYGTGLENYKDAGLMMELQ